MLKILFFKDKTDIVYHEVSTAWLVTNLPNLASFFSSYGPFWPKITLFVPPMSSKVSKILYDIFTGFKRFKNSSSLFQLFHHFLHQCIILKDTFPPFSTPMYNTKRHFSTKSHYFIAPYIFLDFLKWFPGAGSLKYLSKNILKILRFLS
jgi:hypothetical protein